MVDSVDDFERLIAEVARDTAGDRARMSVEPVAGATACWIVRAASLDSDNSWTESTAIALDWPPLEEDDVYRKRVRNEVASKVRAILPK